MTTRACRLGVLLAIGVAACGGTAGTEVEPTPERRPETTEPADPEPRLVRMLVLRPHDALELGDTVRVDMSARGPENVVRYEGPGGGNGTIPLQRLGPVGEGRMVVTANRVNVRRCRSRGCSVLGYVTRGQVVRVRDLAGVWFTYTGQGDAEGYIHSSYLQLPVVYRQIALEEIRERTAAYYRRELASLRTEGHGPVCSGHEVRLDGRVVEFEFYTEHVDGPPVDTICEKMRAISVFVQRLMSEKGSGLFATYNAGVYARPPATGEDRITVAAMAIGGRPYCR